MTLRLPVLTILDWQQFLGDQILILSKLKGGKKGEVDYNANHTALIDKYIIVDKLSRQALLVVSFKKRLSICVSGCAVLRIANGLTNHL